MAGWCMKSSMHAEPSCSVNFILNTRSMYRFQRALNDSMASVARIACDQTTSQSLLEENARNIPTDGVFPQQGWLVHTVQINTSRINSMDHINWRQFAHEAPKCCGWCLETNAKHLQHWWSWWTHGLCGCVNESKESAIQDVTTHAHAQSFWRIWHLWCQAIQPQQEMCWIRLNQMKDCCLQSSRPSFEAELENSCTWWNGTDQKHWIGPENLGRFMQQLETRETLDQDGEMRDTTVDTSVARKPNCTWDGCIEFLFCCCRSFCFQSRDWPRDSSQGELNVFIVVQSSCCSKELHAKVCHSVSDQTQPHGSRWMC